MKKSDLSKIQIIIAIVAAAYVLMPDLFAGPLDDTAIAALAGVTEAVLLVMRATLPTSDPEPESIAHEYYSEDYYSDD